MQVLTSLSGLPLSAASAGFAPTNSADVSAIASAYQVVSSTGTQLHAGTAYLTGVNGAPISASRAGQAANASLANSAYYDGTGRLISALPDSAAVSAIASSYAESAASGKQDALEFGYDANNLISSIDGSALAGGGGGGGGLVTAIGSLDGHITSINSSDIVGRPSAVMTRSADENILEADEWMSMGPNTTEGRQFSYSQGINKVYLEPDHTSNDMSATAYGDDGNAVGVVPLTATAFTISSDTAIITRVDANSDENGLSMFISGFRYIPSGDYIAALPSIDACVLKSSTVVQLGTAATADTGNGIAFAQGLASAGNNGFAFGFYAEAENGVAFGNGATGKFSSLAAGTSVSAYSCSLAVGGYATADYVSMAQGQNVSAYDNSFARGSHVSAVNSATVLGQYNLSGDGYGSSGAAFVLGDGMASYARHDLMVVTKDGEITMFSGTADTVGTGIMSSIRAISAAATGGGGGGGVDSATVSAIASAYVESGVSSKLDTTAFNSGDFYSTGNPSGFVGSSYVDSAVSGKMNSSASSSFYTTANESGFVDSAYVESSVSGKLDTTAFNSGDFYSTGNPSAFVDSAYVESSVSGKLDTTAFNSGDFYSTGNPSGFVDSAYVDSAVSGKLDITAFNSGDFYSTGNPSGFVDSAYVESSVSGKMDSSASSSFYTTANESGFIDSAYVESAVSGKMDSSASSSFYTTANESGFVDSAYVESSVSGKLDTTAFNSGDFYSTGNPSGFVDSAYVESSVSGKQDASAMTSYALSSDVSGTVDLVSSQSANWGGSALQLSAGPGVKFEKSGNVLVASTDRELLWSGSATGNYTAQLSESKANFEKVEIWHTWNPSVDGGPYVNTYGSDFERVGCMGGGCTNGANAPFSFLTVFSANNTAVTILSAGQGQGATPNDFNDVYKCLLRVYGINRTAEA